MRFLNADEIARGLSPLDPTLSAFKAGRLLLEEARTLMKAKASFAIESTLSGRTYVALIREAKALGYRFLLHYIVIGSGAQAVKRVELRVRIGGHHVPKEDDCVVSSAAADISSPTTCRLPMNGCCGTMLSLLIAG